MYSQNRLQIVPKYNLINNVGLRDDSAHSSSKCVSKKIKKIYNMETFDVNFPLVHPRYVMPDIEYEKRRNKILGYNENPILKTIKRPFKTIRILILNPKHFFTVLKKKIIKRKETER